MQPDDHVCLCFRVSQRKLVTYLKREKPRVASQLADCLGAGTGCHWCVPFLEELFRQWEAGEEPGLAVSPEHYSVERKSFHQSGSRNPSFIQIHTHRPDRGDGDPTPTDDGVE